MTTTSIPALLEPIQERLEPALFHAPYKVDGRRIIQANNHPALGPYLLADNAMPVIAEFIANAPTDTARLLAAVKAVDSILSQALTMISADPDVSEYERGFDDSTRGLSAKLRSAVEAALGGL